MLSLNVVADHAAGFAHVNLVWPVVVVDEFVLCQPPLAHFLSQVPGHALVVAEEPHEALLIGGVLVDDAFASPVISFRVGVVHVDVVRTESAVVVGVRLAVGHLCRMDVAAIGASLQVAGENLVAQGIVVIGFWKRNAVFRRVGHAHAETICLDPFVACAFLAGAVAVHPWEQSAGGIAWDDVRIDI